MQDDEASEEEEEEDDDDDEKPNPKNKKRRLSQQDSGDKPFSKSYKTLAIRTSRPLPRDQWMKAPLEAPLSPTHVAILRSKGCCTKPS